MNQTNMSLFVICPIKIQTFAQLGKSICYKKSLLSNTIDWSVTNRFDIFSQMSI